MSFTKVVPQLWMLLPKETRDKIAADFSLTKTGISEIRDQEVISDGYCQADLDALTAERMAEYVGSVESFPRLWELTGMKAHSELHPPQHVIGSQEMVDKLNNLKEVSNAEFETITGQDIQKVADSSTNTKPNGKTPKTSRAGDRKPANAVSV